MQRYHMLLAAASGLKHVCGETVQANVRERANVYEAGERMAAASSDGEGRVNGGQDVGSVRRTLVYIISKGVKANNKYI
jgi:hypothetical protein